MNLHVVLLLAQFVLGGDIGMNPNEFVSHAAVKIVWDRDEDLCTAIDESRRSFTEFKKAFDRRGIRQTDFVVTVMRRDGLKLIPTGILVDQLGETIEGREIPNALLPKPAARVACRFEHLIDWRYTDTFELEGGRLYRALFHRQSPTVKRTIGNHHVFLLDWDKSATRDAELRELMRDVANLRHAQVERKLRADKTLQTREALVAVPGFEGGDLRAKLFPMTVSEWAAQFGDARMLELLRSLGLVHEGKGCNPLTSGSVTRGNTDAVRYVLELGFDPEVTDDIGGFPLKYAVAWDRGEVVKLLLKHGADCNRRDNSQRTPIFHARSVPVAQDLLAAGARLDLVDEVGKTCVQAQLEHGRADIVNLMVNHGARRDARWKLGLNEAQTKEKGQQEIRKSLRETDPQALADFEFGQSIDYGCVLPIRDLPLTAK